MPAEPAATPPVERAANANVVPSSGTTRPYWLGHLRDHVLRQELRDCARRESGATAELLAAAVDRTNAEIEMLLATRFSPAIPVAEPMLFGNSGNKVAVRPPVPSDSRAREQSGEPLRQAAAAVGDTSTNGTDTGFAFMASEADLPGIDDATGNAIASPAAGEDLAAAPSAPASAGAAASRDGLAEADMAAIAPCSHGLARYLRFTPVAANCAALKGMLSLQAMREFKRLQELAGSFGASADAADLLEKAIKAYADALEKKRFGANASARASASVSAGTSTRATHADRTRRHIPSGIRRAVYERDGGRCTFVGPDGKRCACRTGLEFDHVQPLARGGLTTVANLRLRRRAHNQLEARRAFGERFVAGKQEQARARAAGRRAAPTARARPRRVT